MNEKPKIGEKGRKLPQYIAAFSGNNAEKEITINQLFLVCLGSLSSGTALGWTGNITNSMLQEGALNKIYVSSDNYAWIGSCMTLGAMVVCFPIGYVCDLIGRKWTMLSTIIPFTIGWLLIIFASNINMILAGRFLTGLAGGSFSVTAPLYTSEIAQKEIRGRLGSFFQLLLASGIFLVYILGGYTTPQITSIICAMVPIIFGIVFFFQPETPVYLLKVGKTQEAINSLKRLRGDNYNIDAEILEINKMLQSQKETHITFRESFKKRATKRSLLICFSLMFFQQFSGINAVVFYMGTIFEETNIGMSTKEATLLVSAMQIISVFFAFLVIDKLGRKILLILSALSMALSGISFGIYCTLKDRQVLDSDQIENIRFLPVLSVCIFRIMFSLGFGTIPWVISAELLPAEIKSNASSAAGTFNWFLAFIVTKFYGNLKDAIGADIAFYIFSCISLIGTVFVFFIVPETKGKTMQQIQDVLSGGTRSNSKNNTDNKDDYR